MLKYKKQSKLWARQDSNLRPSDYESPALTAAPRAPVLKYQVLQCQVSRT
jgi:hypothetical protein